MNAFALTSSVIVGASSRHSGEEQTSSDAPSLLEWSTALLSRALCSGNC